MRDNVTLQQLNAVSDSCESTLVLKRKAHIFQHDISIHLWHSNILVDVLLNSWLLLIISRWIMVWHKGVFCLAVLIYKRLQIWRHNYVISRNEYLTFYINRHIIHGDTKETVSGVFFWTQCIISWAVASVCPADRVFSRVLCIVLSKIKYMYVDLSAVIVVNPQLVDRFRLFPVLPYRSTWWNYIPTDWAGLANIWSIGLSTQSTTRSLDIDKKCATQMSRGFSRSLSSLSQIIVLAKVYLPTEYEVHICIRSADITTQPKM